MADAAVVKPPLPPRLVYLLKSDMLAVDVLREMIQEYDNSDPNLYFFITIDSTPLVPTLLGSRLYKGMFVLARVYRKSFTRTPTSTPEDEAESFRLDAAAALDSWLQLYPPDIVFNGMEEISKGRCQVVVDKTTIEFII